jgi:hypothetical protein
VAASESLAAFEDAVRRLRELYEDAADEDRPRAALWLGLAIADIVPRLPADDPGRAELAEEGLRRLEESGTPRPLRPGLPNSSAATGRCRRKPLRSGSPART